jgi:hypothetical protein
MPSRSTYATSAAECWAGGPAFAAAIRQRIAQRSSGSEDTGWFSDSCRDAIATLAEAAIRAEQPPGGAAGWSISKALAPVAR